MSLLGKLNAYCEGLRDNDPVYRATQRLLGKRKTVLSPASSTAMQATKVSHDEFLGLFVAILKSEGVGDDQIDSILAKLNVRR